METHEAIRGRRSIRKFVECPVSEDAVREVIAAGMCAPSAQDERTWHFFVIDDRALLGRVAGFHAGAEAARGAPVGILTCHEVALEKLPGFWIQDLAAATQNMLLAAHDLGLGAVWIGCYPVESFIDGFRSLLSIPDKLIPFSLVVLGHPAEQPEPRDPFLADRVHRA